MVSLAAASNELVNPNLHVVLVHYPIGLLTIGVLIECLSFLWPDEHRGPRHAGRWMVLLGALSMVPTAFAGMYALADVHGTELPRDGHQLLVRHGWSQAAATALTVFATLVWLSGSDRWRRGVRVPVLLMLLGGVGMMTFGAYLSGEAVYAHGAGVSPMGHEPERESAGAATTNPTAATQPAERTVARGERGLAYVLPPLQGHLVGAGCVVAASLAGMGLGLRRVAAGREAEQNMLEAKADVARRHEGPSGTGNAVDMGRSGPGMQSLLLSKSLNPGVQVAARAPVVPAARFFVLALVLAVLTAAAGYWYLAREAGLWADVSAELGSRASLPDRVHAFTRSLLGTPFERDRETKQFEHARRAFHVVGGVATIVLLAVLAAVARWVRRSRWALLLVSTLLLAVVAAQTWLGALLLYEGPEGAVTRFERQE